MDIYVGFCINLRFSLCTMYAFGGLSRFEISGDFLFEKFRFDCITWFAKWIGRNEGHIQICVDILQSHLLIFTVGYGNQGQFDSRGNLKYMKFVIWRLKVAKRRV